MPQQTFNSNHGLEEPAVDPKSGLPGTITKVSFSSINSDPGSPIDVRYEITIPESTQVVPATVVEDVDLGG